MTALHKPFRYVFVNVTLMLVLVNVALFMFVSMNPQLMAYMGLSVTGVVGYRFFWQPFTYMFMHGGFQHILFNMLGLLVFGVPVEKSLGSKEFALMYFVCGILNGVIFVAVHYLLGRFVNPMYWYINLIGASGAIYSILLVFAVVFPRSIISIWGIIPVPAPLLVVIYAVIEIGSQLFNVRSGISHMSHLVGFALAWLYLIVRMNKNPMQIWKDAWRR
ncbi:MAG: rhomboid family intramembrane serine protease [Treponema sp.]|nr:rhomboid family intramembrane serine protease [Treponema sp.]